jgi:membrane protease YdiL (CAAX protease family)
MVHAEREVPSIRCEPDLAPRNLVLASLGWQDFLRILSGIVLAIWGLNIGLAVSLFGGLTYPDAGHSGLAFFFLLQTTVPVLACWVAMKRKGKAAFWRLQFPRIPSIHVLLSVVLGVVLASFMVVTFRWSLVLPSFQTTLIRDFLTNMQGRIALGVVLVFSCPLEELFLRGFLFPFVRAKSGFIGGLLALTLWLASDFLPRFPGPWHWMGMTLGFTLLVKHVVLTIQRELSSSLFPPMLTHLVCNLVIASVIFA